AAFGVAGTHAASASEAEAEALMAKHGFDLILLDINMPGRSGFDFCRQVRATDDIPIIFISARASDDDEVLALGVGGATTISTSRIHSTCSSPRCAEHSNASPVRLSPLMTAGSNSTKPAAACGLTATK